MRTVNIGPAILLLALNPLQAQERVIADQSADTDFTNQPANPVENLISLPFQLP